MEFRAGPGCGISQQVLETDFFEAVAPVNCV